MILSFKDEATEDLYHGRKSRKARTFPVNIVATALRKLDMLNAARRLEDLRVVRGNRLEALKGDWKGLFSIRVNDQWRVVFRWHENGVENVSLTDYHS